MTICDKVLSEEARRVILDSEATLRFETYICVLRIRYWVRIILKEAHDFKYFIHPGAPKFYPNL